MKRKASKMPFEVAGGHPYSPGDVANTNSSLQTDESDDNDQEDYSSLGTVKLDTKSRHRREAPDDFEQARNHLPKGRGGSRTQSPLPRHGSMIEPRAQRLSVQSLLSEDPYPESDQPQFNANNQSHTCDNKYGVDLRKPGLDLPMNDDHLALSGDTIPSRIGNLNDSTARYYQKPEIVNFPEALEPLPPAIMSNPMNILYLHYFKNHTARTLVAHDCHENPFRTILVQSKWLSLKSIKNPILCNCNMG